MTQGSYPVARGSLDATVAGIGHLKGRFTSPTQGSGTVELSLEFPVSRQPWSLGEWRWSAQAQ